MTQISDYVVATYLVEEQSSRLESRATSIAHGLTVGSWTDIPAALQPRMRPFCGVVEGVEVLAELSDGRVQAHLSIGYPIKNLTVSIPALLTTVFGKLSMDGTIKLVQLSLPGSWVRQFLGPKFGTQGLRELTRVQDRPLLMSIFKSCIGLDLDELVQQFREQALGGANLIKDDEIFFSEELVSPEQRVQAFARVASEVKRETGQDVLYAVNLTGPTFQLRDRARRLADSGAGALLLNVYAYGLDVLQELAADSDIQVPIMAHPAISGALYGAPQYGISAHIVLGQLLRLAGADIAIYPSAYGSVQLAHPESRKLVESLTEENGLKPSVPAPSAGIHPGMVHTLVGDLGTDFIVNSGGAIHGHPSGTRAGGQAFVAAIDAAMAGIPLTIAAEGNEALRTALDKWGGS
jgi:2,3-diketo-5-methylthiopentyl-1-phosphate enolase